MYNTSARSACAWLTSIQNAQNRRDVTTLQNPAKGGTSISLVPEVLYSDWKLNNN